MNSGHLQARRATLDDLAQLRRFWTASGLDVEMLERELTDFQVAEPNGGGPLLGAVALRIIGQQGFLHSETVVEEERGKELRERLWARALAVARNHGLHRIWTSEVSADWDAIGFAAPDAALRKKHLPIDYAPEDEAWRVFKLREEAQGASLERELELLTLARRESSERLTRQVSLIKNTAYVVLFIAITLAAVAMALAVLPKSFWAGRLQRQPDNTRPAFENVHPPP